MGIENGFLDLKFESSYIIIHIIYVYTLYISHYKVHF